MLSTQKAPSLRANDMMMQQPYPIKTLVNHPVVSDYWAEMHRFSFGALRLTAETMQYLHAKTCEICVWRSLVVRKMGPLSNFTDPWMRFSEFSRDCCDTSVDAKLLPIAILVIDH